MVRQSPSKRTSERTKWLVAGILAFVLIYLLVSGGGPSSSEASIAAADPGRSEPSRRSFPGSPNGSSVDARSGDGDDRLPTPQTTSPPPVAAETLPRHDVSALLQRDPFSLVTAEQPAESIALVAKPIDSRPLMDLDHVQAVYMTPAGGNALVDGKVVSISDPARLIMELKARRQSPSHQGPASAGP